MKEVRLELAFSRYETYEDQDKGGAQTKGVAGIHPAAKEYVGVL